MTLDSRIDDSDVPMERPRSWRAATMDFLASVGAWLWERLAAERERWILWLPVGVAVGVALYFTLPVEPPGYAGLFFVGVCAVYGWFRRDEPAHAVAALLAGLLAIGFTAAQWRTARVDAPMLQKPLSAVPIEGRVLDLDYRDSGVRIVIGRPRAADDTAMPQLAKARVSLTRYSPVPKVGDRVRVLSVLNPPPRPVAPGAYDFARRAYFQRIGGSGYAIGHLEVIAPGKRSSVALSLEAARQEIRRRIRAVVAQPAAGFATAILTGERGEVAEAELNDLRNAGLAHLLAISGLHIGLVAGIAFFCVRTGIALFPAAALHWPSKKLAAGGAFLAALAYTLLVGAPVPTQRALMMTGLILLAVLLDRQAVSMRLVAFAALVVLLIWPETLLGASFQMSFAAVVALIAAYEANRQRWRDAYGEGGLGRRVMLYFGGIVFTTVIASLATAPLSWFHFQHVALSGQFANLIAVPLMALWVMPCGVAAIVLMPFGIEALALGPMALGIDGILAAAQWATGHAWAYRHSEPPSFIALLLLVFGGLWLCLWRRPWRWAGLALMLAGIAMPSLRKAPDILVSRDAGLVAVRAPDGALWLSQQRTNQFVAAAWLRRNGQTEAATLPSRGALWNDRLRCDPYGCLLKRHGHSVALARSRGAAIEDCARVGLVVAEAWLDPECHALRVDGRLVRREGAAAIRLLETGLSVTTVEQVRGDRPWTR